MTFKYIELFAGIGGFRSALDALGGRCVFASEIDPFATLSYHALYGEKYDGDRPSLPDTLGKFLNRKPVGKYAPELRGDITKIDAEEIPNHDIIVAGFPCQSFSVAGQRKGFEDARGTLFFEIARIASAKKPRLMLLENVKGLLSHDGGRTFETMCAILNDIGYAIDFRVLNSKYYGVPQNRERIFIVADRDAEHAEWVVSGNDVVAKAKRRMQALGERTFNFDWPENNAVTTRLRDVLEAQVDEKYYLSEEKTAKLIAQLEEREHIASSDGCEMVGMVDLRGNDSIKRVYSPAGIAPTLTTMGGGHREPKIAELQQYSDGSGLAYTVDANYAKGTSPGDIGKGRRTHIMEPAALTERRSEEAKEIRRNARKEGRDFSPRRGKVVVPREDGIANCVTATQTIEQTLLERPRYRIRKLTPRECWRLQGFSDAQHDAVMNAGISDSQRYKQAGNAVTVNVIQAVGERLVARLPHHTELEDAA